MIRYAITGGEAILIENQRIGSTKAILHIACYVASPFTRAAARVRSAPAAHFLRLFFTAGGVGGARRQQGVRRSEAADALKS
jgi:hypothetical protein